MNQAVWLLLISFTLLIRITLSEENNQTDFVKTSENDKLAKQIYAIIEHYKQDDPIGLPGVPVPDPMPVPDIKESLPVGTLIMKNTYAHGISKFRLQSVKTDLKGLQLIAVVQLSEIILKGNYTLSMFTRVQGPSIIVVKNVVVTGNITLAVERDGKIRTQNIEIDIKFQGMTMDFQNLGLMGSFFQSFVNTNPNMVFDIMKPFILKSAYEKLTPEIDANIDKLSRGHVFPNSILMLDMAVSYGSKQIRQLGYDPYQVRNDNNTLGVVSMQLKNIWISGVSSFHRVGVVEIAMENKTVSVKMEVGTLKIIGATDWELSIWSGMLSRTGDAEFTIDYIKASFEMQQPLDTRKHPVIRNLQFELGNMQVHCEGAGTIGYILEASVNILPNLLRNRIMDILENTLKDRVQQHLNTINTEQLIKDKMVQFQNMDFGF